MHTPVRRALTPPPPNPSPFRSPDSNKIKNVYKTTGPNEKIKDSLKKELFFIPEGDIEHLISAENFETLTPLFGLPKNECDTPPSKSEKI